MIAGVVVAFATVPARPLAEATDTLVTVPPPDGVAKVPSHLKKVVVLFGGVGTAPHTVAVITGRSELRAILGTQVPVVFFKIPVPRPAREVPFILVTVIEFVLFAVPSNEDPAEVASPVIVPIVRAVCKAVAVQALPVIVV